MSSDSSLGEPLCSFIYGVFNPTHNPSYHGSFWEVLFDDGHDFDSQMLLSEFITSRGDLPRTKLVEALIIPVEDLANPAFQYSHAYKSCSDMVNLGHIMKRGGICLVFEGMVILASIISFLTT